jgi:hypothetical protein
MGNQSKKQHYVPQFLLRHFSAANDDKTVFLFDKQKRETRRQAIRDVGHENYFYDPADVLSTDSFEAQLAKLEGDAAFLVREIIATGDLSRVNGHTDLLAFFLATQLFRTRQQRTGSIRIFKLLQQAFLLKGFASDFSDLGAPSQERFRSHQIEFMKQLVPIAAAELAQRSWTLLFATPPSVFVIGDHPAITWNRSEDPNVGFGLLEPGTEVYLPINPRMCLLVVADQYRERALNQLTDGVAAPAVFLSGSGPVLREHWVSKQNGLQLIFAERYVYSSTADFRFVEDLLRQHPEFAQAPGPDDEEFSDIIKMVELWRDVK